MSWNRKRSLFPVFCLLTLAGLPPKAPAQTARQPAGQPARQFMGSSQRLAALQLQNAFQQQQNAVQNAVQQTAALVQTARRQNAVLRQSFAPTSVDFVRQQIALQNALQQTNVLAQTTQQQNPALSRMALGQLNTLRSVLQRSLVLEIDLQRQNNVLTSLQMSQLSQELPNLSSLITSQPPPTPTRMSGAGDY